MFRRVAVNAAAHRLFGGVTVAVPPSGRVALAISIVALAALIAVTCLVEIPQRSRAVGVLMPVGGLIDAVAMQSGQIENAFVSVGQLVKRGHVLFTISDPAHLRGESAADVNLRSLQIETELLKEAHASRQQIIADRLQRLKEETRTASEQMRLVQERYEAHGQQLNILEKRFLRWQELQRGGHVSRDALELEQAKLIRARAEDAEIRQLIAASSQAIQTLIRSREETKKQLELNVIEHALSEERLRREIDLGQLDIVQTISAADQSVIAQILVQPGETVRPGQVLAKLRRPGDRLQAWLYLSTSSARQMRKGQAVEISLDAYPHQVYGAHTAIVSSVSGVALLPKDIRAPLMLAGPVFEVRAELMENSINADGRNWPLTPGISFSAEIIQRRRKLYEWLLQSFVGHESNG